MKRSNRLRSQLEASGPAPEGESLRAQGASPGVRPAAPGYDQWRRDAPAPRDPGAAPSAKLQRAARLGEDSERGASAISAIP